MERELKLNTKRTTFIGLAFFTILMLWQVYNYYAPLFLEDLLIAKFGGNPEEYAYIIGAIMACDNLFGLFMLPIFGSLSDKTNTKYGKRMPFIFIGTILAAIIFPFIPVFYLNNSLVGVFIAMGLTLLVMNMYRNPAVALMPDITPKPLRSKANGIINLVGYLGAIFAGALPMVLGEPDTAKHAAILPFILTSVLMIMALVTLVLKIKENKIAQEVKEDMEYGETLAETNEAISEDKKLSGKDKVDLYILIISTFFWFFGFNAIESFGSLYARNALVGGMSWGTVVIVLTICSMISFIPASMLASKIGRKNTVLTGLILIVVAALSCALFSKINIVFLLLIAVCGIGWAMINCNSYPMVVELADKNSIGKYTGYYYTSSMLAQTITPVFVGLLFYFVESGYKILFPYAAISMIVAAVIFINVRIKSKK